MAMEFKALVDLAKHVARADKNAPTAYTFEGTTYSYSDLNNTLRDELNEMTKTYSLYRDNKNKVFSLLEQSIDEVFPKRVLEKFGQFAETKVFKQGDKPIFRQKITAGSRRRAKQFIGKVGLAGLYEVFKLDGQSFEVATNAIGGAAQVGFEEYLDGRADFSDLLTILMDGMEECVYVEIEKQLIGAVNNVQTANKASTNGFIEADMDRLLSIADSYGTKADIYCTFEFAAQMIPTEGWISDDMRNTMWSQGHLGNYKGHRVIILDQSYEDETNTTKVIDPKYAWIIPSGASKPVKIAFEGDTIVDEYVGYDRSREVQVYKKVGVRAVFSNDICVYENTKLTRAA